MIRMPGGEGILWISKIPRALNKQAKSTACMCKGFWAGGRVPLLVKGVSRAPLSPFTEFLVEF